MKCKQCGNTTEFGAHATSYNMAKLTFDGKELARFRITDTGDTDFDEYHCLVCKAEGDEIDPEGFRG